MKAADQQQPARGGGGEKHGGSSSPKNTYRLHVLFSEAAMDFSLSLSPSQPRRRGLYFSSLYFASAHINF